MQLNAKNISCVRGDRRLFQDLSFTLKSGDALWLSGNNGAGKTTLLRTIAGFLKPEHGEILIDPLSDQEEETPRAELCHYIGHVNGIKHSFTVEENLNFLIRYFAVPKDGQTNISHTLKHFNLENLKDIPAGYLSAGQKRRLCLARLHLIKRPVWLLDEPTVSLDQASQYLTTALMQTHVKAGGILILTTHIPIANLNFKLKIDLSDFQKSHETKDAGHEEELLDGDWL